jgi:GNAT superfamily N-acetyltransferase
VTYAQVAGQVAREWARRGRVAAPGDMETPHDDLAFWDEVDRRFSASQPVEEAYTEGLHARDRRGRWRDMLDLPRLDLKADKRLSTTQVQARARTIVQGVLDFYGHDEATPDVAHEPDYLASAGTDARFRHTGQPLAGVLYGRRIMERAQDPELGVEPLRPLAHEAAHAISGVRPGPLPGISQTIEEGSAEVLSLWFWHHRGQRFDERDAVRIDGKWNTELAHNVAYRNEVQEVVKRAASAVGWDRHKIIDEVERVMRSDHGERIKWRDATNAHFDSPKGVDDDAVGLVRWLLTGHDEQVVNPQEWSAPPPPVGKKGESKGGKGYSSDEAFGTNTALGHVGEDAFVRILGGEVLHPEGKGAQSPLDVRYDGYGFEVKAVSTKTLGYKATPKPYEIEQKEAHAKELGVKAALAIVVIDSENGTAHAYFRDGLKGGRLSKNTGWQFLGSTTLTPEVAEAYEERLHPRNRLGEWVRGLGFKAYRVGGATRDPLLGKTPKDEDFMLMASPEAIRRAVTAQGGTAEDLMVRDRLVGVRAHMPGVTPPEGVELAPPRVEVSTGPARHDFVIAPHPAVDETVPEGYEIRPADKDSGWFNTDGEWNPRVLPNGFDTLSDPKWGTGEGRVVYHDGKPVASLTWTRVGGEARLGTAYTHPDHRGKGLFRALVQPLRAEGKPLDAFRWENPDLKRTVRGWGDVVSASGPSTGWSRHRARWVSCASTRRRSRRSHAEGCRAPRRRS